MLSEVTHYLKLYLLAVLAIVLWYGSRYLIGIRHEMAKYFLDSKQPLWKRIAYFFLLTIIVFAACVVFDLLRETGRL